MSKLNKKEELIMKYLNGGMEVIEEIRDREESAIKDYKENGFGDTHPDNIEDIKSSHNYTHGYSIGHIELFKVIKNLISLDEQGIIDLMKEEEKIKEENDKYLNSLFKEITGKDRNEI